MKTAWVVGIVMGCLAAGPLASASVVGYWRMEASTNLGKDSGPNALDLGNANALAVDYAAHPASGAGSHFPSAFTGIGSNTGQGVWSGSQSASAGQQGLVLSASGHTQFQLSSFTIEAFANASTLATW
jgi:hypothetical protein